MKETVSFSKEEIEKASLNYSELRSKGISYIQELSGDIWTDFNTHDPGVTILEQLCYALTDVSFRTDYPINDLLFGGRDKYDTAKNNAFFAPANIYKTHPVTILDIRKLLIDHFNQIQNVWIQTMDNHGFEEKLILTEKVEILPKYIFGNSLKGKANSQYGFVEQVKKYLNKNRNIGEDIDQVILLKSMNITIHFTIYLTEQKNLEVIIAKILRSLFEHLYSPVQRFNLREMYDDNYESAEIFSGPKLTNGFIKSKSLGERITKIDVNGLQRLLSKSIEGHKCTVTNIEYGGNDYEILEVEDRCFFHLLEDENTDTNLQGPLEKILKHMVVRIGNKIIDLTATNKQEIHRIFFELWAKKYRQYSIEASKGDSREGLFNESFKGVDRNPEHYYSLQHHFPQIYGIGKEGLPKSEFLERHAKAQQLKAYLLFFEQHLANHLSQINNVHSFFNIDQSKETGRTYFSQHIASVENMEQIHPGISFDFDACVYHRTIKRKYVFAEIDVKKLSELSLEKKRVLLKRILSEKELFDKFISKTREQKIPEEILYGSVKIRTFVVILHELKFNWLDENTTKNFWSAVVLSFVLLSKIEGKYYNSIVFAEAFLYHLKKMLTALGKEHLAADIVIKLQEIHPFLKKDLPYYTEFTKLCKQVEEQQDEESYFDRKNRVYNHLIARFGEEFNPLPWEIAEQLQPERNEADFQKELLMRKSEFLMNIVDLSANTLKGEFLDWDTKKNKKIRELSGLEQVILAKTGLKSRSKETSTKSTYFNDPNELFYIVDHILLRAFLKEPIVGYGFKIVDEFNQLIIENKEWYKKVTDRDAALKELFEELKESDDIKQRELTYLFDKDLDTNGRSRLRAVENIRAKGTKTNKRGEFGQNRLIYRRKLKETSSIIFSKAIEEPQVIEEDFFNLSISIVFPSWPVRLQNERFKSYIKELIIERVPSHIKVHFYSLDEGAMEKFEKFYLKWEMLRAQGKEDTIDFKDVSYQLYNILYYFEETVQ